MLYDKLSGLFSASIKMSRILSFMLGGAATYALVELDNKKNDGKMKRYLNNHMQNLLDLVDDKNDEYFSEDIFKFINLVNFSKFGSVGKKVSKFNKKTPAAPAALPLPVDEGPMFEARFWFDIEIKSLSQSLFRVYTQESGNTDVKASSPFVEVNVDKLNPSVNIGAQNSQS